MRITISLLTFLAIGAFLVHPIYSQTEITNTWQWVGGAIGEDEFSPGDTLKVKMRFNLVNEETVGVSYKVEIRYFDNLGNDVDPTGVGAGSWQILAGGASIIAKTHENSFTVPTMGHANSYQVSIELLRKLQTAPPGAPWETVEQTCRVFTIVTGGGGGVE